MSVRIYGHHRTLFVYIHVEYSSVLDRSYLNWTLWNGYAGTGIARMREPTESQVKRLFPTIRASGDPGLLDNYSGRVFSTPQAVDAGLSAPIESISTDGSDEFV